MKKQTTLFLLLLVSAIVYSCGGSKSKLLEKNWKATELTLGETKLTADAVGGINLDFKADGSFSYYESGAADQGKWSLSEDGSKITLNYLTDNRTVVQTIKELSAEKLIVDYEEHGMKRSITLVPETK
ncbi:MAG TPA: lipocalin family protein [Cytophagaceae bacterium]|nr:lipocalin family protein [Cytophagaceae bacterium]